jgi:tripartite-type tricarboxylate transporter receptor subunit TctC
MLHSAQLVPRCGCAGLAVSRAIGEAVHAQDADCENRPTEVIVDFTAGSGADTAARARHESAFLARASARCREKRGGANRKSPSGNPG